MNEWLVIFWCFFTFVLTIIIWCLINDYIDNNYNIECIKSWWHMVALDNRSSISSIVCNK
jgi:hypothetical protein